jgi:hypothetical protein
MPSQREIDELIKMLDASMTSGSGHVNVVVDEGITLEEVSIEKGMGCTLGNTACNIPNLQIDEED